MRGLIITATVTTPVVSGIARPNLASLLAWANAGVAGAPSVSDRIIVVDIPLAVLWRDADGKPLWAGTDIYPAGEPVRGREYLHKRYPAHRANLGRKMKINTAAGQFKEQRRPVLTLSARHWVCACIATDVDQVAALLKDVRSIGPKGAAGYGAVHEWRIEEADISAEFVLRRRAVPVASGLSDGEVAPNRAWVPPYWHSPWWDDCHEGQSCF